MYQHKLPRHRECSIAIAMEVMGGKWKACLLNALQRGIRRPSDLQRAYPQAPLRVLTQQLQELVRHGLAHKVIYSVVPAKVEYFLTPLGETVFPVLDALRAWGTAHGEALRADAGQLATLPASPTLSDLPEAANEEKTRD